MPKKTKTKAKRKRLPAMVPLLVVKLIDEFNGLVTVVRNDSAKLTIDVNNGSMVYNITWEKKTGEVSSRVVRSDDPDWDGDPQYVLEGNCLPR